MWPINRNPETYIKCVAYKKKLQSDWLFLSHTLIFISIYFQTLNITNNHCVAFESLCCTKQAKPAVGSSHRERFVTLPNFLGKQFCA